MRDRDRSGLNIKLLAMTLVVCDAEGFHVVQQTAPDLIQVL